MYFPISEILPMSNVLSCIPNEIFYNPTQIRLSQVLVVIIIIIVIIYLLCIVKRKHDTIDHVCY